MEENIWSKLSYPRVLTDGKARQERESKTAPQASASSVEPTVFDDGGRRNGSTHTQTFRCQSSSTLLCTLLTLLLVIPLTFITACLEQFYYSLHISRIQVKKKSLCAPIGFRGRNCLSPHSIPSLNPKPYGPHPFFVFQKELREVVWWVCVFLQEDAGVVCVCWGVGGPETHTALFVPGWRLNLDWKWWK